MFGVLDTEFLPVHGSESAPIELGKPGQEQWGSSYWVPWQLSRLWILCEASLVIISHHHSLCQVTAISPSGQLNRKREVIVDQEGEPIPFCALTRNTASHPLKSKGSLISIRSEKANSYTWRFKPALPTRVSLHLNPRILAHSQI